MDNLLEAAKKYVDGMKPNDRIIGEHIFAKAAKEGFSDRDSMITFEREVWGLMARKFNMIEFANMGMGKMVHIISVKS